MLTANHLSLTLGGRPILSGIRLQLEPGRITALLGPNGAGKSSLVRILSGEWQADSGCVELDGVPLARIPARELARRRACLPQESSLTFAFTVLEVVLLGRSPHMRGGERPQDYAAARRALATVDLADRERDPYTALSGGEKQRVHLARVLAQIDEPEAGGPRYLFLDEPANNLDLSHQRMIYRVVRDLARQDAAVLMVMHDLNQAFQVADWVVLLDRGRVAVEGPPMEIACSDACERIFGVPVRRIALTGRECPYLVFGGVDAPE